MPYCFMDALWAWDKTESKDDCTEFLIRIDYCPVDALCRCFGGG